jgi:hypothetical protein
MQMKMTALIVLLSATVANAQLTQFPTKFDVEQTPWVVNYAPGQDPVTTIRTDLTEEYDNKVNATLPVISNLVTLYPNDFVIGYSDNTTTDTLTVQLTVPGNDTLSGTVGFDDLLAIAQNFGQSVAAGDNVSWTGGDLNYDNKINFDDLLIVAQHFGDSFATTLASVEGSSSSASLKGNTTFTAVTGSIAGNPQSVPEPNAAWLVAAVTAVFTLTRRPSRKPLVAFSH